MNPYFNLYKLDNIVFINMFLKNISVRDMKTLIYNFITKCIMFP